MTSLSNNVRNYSCIGGLILVACVRIIQGLTAFEKLTDLDYRGTSYYTIRNLSLYECQGWCRQEPECTAASFSFVVNPLAPIQETVCLLQNDTAASNPTASPQKAVSTYYMVKLSVRSDKVCQRPWSFERVPNKMLRGLDNALIFTSTKEACLAACLNEWRFPCRSAEYNYVTLQCHLSEYDRRTVDDFVELAEAQGVDYFENLCLKTNETCKTGNKVYQIPSLGVSDERVTQYADLHYYVDKELVASTQTSCKRACEVEQEFLCRSFLYKPPPVGQTKIKASPYNCQLFHLDHWTLPDGPATYLNSERPLIDMGDTVGTYFENLCERPQIEAVEAETQSPVGLEGSGTTDVNCDHTGTCYDVSVQCKDTKISVQVKTNKPFNGRIYALGRSETCNVAVTNSDLFRLDLSMGGLDCNTQAMGGVFTNTVVLQHHNVVMTKADKIYKVKCTYDISSKNITFGMMPVRDPDMISVTSAPEAPPPRISILDATGREVETVRIGDRLTFRIEIPDNTPYGIFARSCIAMAKDSRSTFQIIDDDGCPVEPSIFPRFTPDGNALQSVYEAFRFTESYGVIFQCNVKYCLGSCEPAHCQWGRESYESWGKRKRRTVSNHGAKSSSEDMTLSQEILVLDLGDEDGDLTINKNTTRYTKGAAFTDETVMLFENCPTRTSVLALAVTCGLLLLVYLCTLFYFLIRKWAAAQSKESFQ